MRRLLLRKNQKGIALMTSLFFLIIVTVLATTAITLSTVQVKVSSSIARWETGLAVAEGAVNHVLPLIQYIHYESRIPDAFCSHLVSPCVPPGQPHPLITELQSVIEDNRPADDPDDPDVEDLHLSPTAFGTFPGMFDVSIDIDSVGSSLMAGGGIEASWAYHGSAYSSSLLKAYKVSVTAATPSGRSRARMQQVLWLRAVM